MDFIPSTTWSTLSIDNKGETHQASSISVSFQFKQQVTIIFSYTPSSELTKLYTPMSWGTWFFTCDFWLEAGGIVLFWWVPVTKVELKVILKLAVAAIVDFMAGLSARITVHWGGRVARLEHCTAEVLLNLLIAAGAHLKVKG